MLGIPTILQEKGIRYSSSKAMAAMAQFAFSSESRMSCLWQVTDEQDINELPIAFNIAWYEQKAVIVLLSLLYLGVKNIHLGPTLPAFLSPNVAKVLVENFGIGGITNVEDDIKMFMEQ